MATRPSPSPPPLAELRRLYEAATAYIVNGAQQTTRNKARSALLSAVPHLLAAAERVEQAEREVKRLSAMTFNARLNDVQEDLAEMTQKMFDERDARIAELTARAEQAERERDEMGAVVEAASLMRSAWSAHWDCSASPGHEAVCVANDALADALAALAARGSR
jgi:hypothetical protein